MVARELDSAQGEEIPLVVIWKLLWRHRLLVSVVAAICTLAALVVALTATPYYRAEAVLTEAPDEGLAGGSSLASQFGGIASLAGIALGGQGIGQAREAKAVLESRRLVEEFIQQEGFIEQMPHPAGKPLTLWQAVRHFRDSLLLIKDDPRKGRTTVAIKWTDAATAAKWTNAFVTLANEMVRKRAIDQATRNIHYLNEQIAKTNVVEVQRVMYHLVENETKTLMLANARPEYAFVVIDPAVPPEERASPKRTLIVLAGMLAGLLLGVFVAFARDVWQREKGVQRGG